MATRGSESVPCPPSHEVELNQSSPRESAPPPGNQEKTTHLRFLLSDDETGFIIGNGAATVRNIRSQSQAHVLLSHQNEYYPGTEGRIVMVLGIIDKILVAVDLVFSKLLDKIYSGAADQVTDITLIVPDACCGGIIGTDGDIIKSLIDVSGADIRLILQELEKDPYYNRQSANPVFPYEDSGIGGMDPINVRPNREDSTSSVIIGVADKHVGLLIGNGGWCIKQIRVHSGAKITISGRGDFISGTSNRKFTITGSESAINSAKSMILEKVPSADVYQSEG